MQQPKQSRALGVWMLTALVAGNMIGSGIFLLPASLASIGSISIIAWLITAAGAIVLALLFAKLSHHMPRVGGPYAYCYEAFGDFVGFEVAYIYWIAMWTGNAGIVVAFISYLSVFFPILNQNLWVSFFACAGTVWLLTLVNIFGIQSAGKVQLVATILKLIPLLSLAFIGIFFISRENLAVYNISGHSSLAAINSAAVLTLWSFIGVESATVPAADVENPKRDIPRATIMGSVLTAIVYIFSTIAVMGILPNATLAASSAPYADAARKVFGTFGYHLVAIGAAISCFGALNGWIMMQGQLPRAAAQHKVFPTPFARLNHRGTPYFGLLISAVLITGLLLLTVNKNLVKQFTFIIELATLGTLIVYLLSTMAEIILFIRNRELFSGERFVHSLLIAGVAFIYCFWSMVGLETRIVYYGTLLLFSGVPIYTWMIWHKDQALQTA